MSGERERTRSGPIDRRIWRASSATRPLLALVGVTGVLIGLLIVWEAQVLARLVSGVYVAHWSAREATRPIFVLLLIVVARAAVTGLSQTLSLNLATAVQADLRERAFRHLLAAGPLALHAERTGELVQILTEGVESIQTFLARYLPQLALTVAVPGVILARVALADPLTGAVLLFTVPLIPVFMILVGRQAERATQRRWRVLGRLGAHFLDVLQGLETLKLLGRSRAQEQGIARASEDFRRETMATLRLAFLSGLVLELLASLSIAMVAVSVGLRLVAGRIPFETAFFLLVLVPDFYAPWRALGAKFHDALNGVEAAGRIFDLLELPAWARGGGRRRVSGRGPWRVAAEGLRFRYAGRESDALRGVNAVLEPGARVAVVGPSGSGKSTLLALLMGFAPPSGGVLTVDGVPLRELELDWWRRQITYISQQPYVFSGSVAENLRIARPGARQDELRRAARQARALDFIESLPGGWDARLGEGGTRLSGGQLQRLALARAFLRDAPYVFLDEPTANLDLESEAAVLEALRELVANRSAVVIAHRLATLELVDEVWVLRDGVLVRSGPLASLAGRPGLPRGLRDGSGGDAGELRIPDPVFTR
ncbi:MAG: thiol reductant ABC exporter subunit CydD [Firmicutes bacterium]|nr:thiol reductant ABC exporter subunit CydD [Bacillota bacterium]